MDQNAITDLWCVNATLTLDIAVGAHYCGQSRLFRHRGGGPAERFASNDPVLYRLPMPLDVTLAASLALLAIAAFAGWRGSKPSDPLKGPRLVPWRFIMVTASALALVFVVHLVNLLGVTTGR